MTQDVRQFVRFCRWLLGLLATARNPLSVFPLLIFRETDRQVDFRVGGERVSCGLSW